VALAASVTPLVQYPYVIRSTDDAALDITPPVITLLGDNPLEIIQGAVYSDPGFTAVDDVDGDITASVVVTGSVDNSTIGSYTLTYNVSDISDNAAIAQTRTVDVVAAPDTTDPVITLLGDNPFALDQGVTFVDPGATALDDVDGDLTLSIVVTGAVDENTVGSYTLTYTATDAAGNIGSATRTVNVTAVTSTETITSQQFELSDTVPGEFMASVVFTQGDSFGFSVSFGDQDISAFSCKFELRDRVSLGSVLARSITVTNADNTQWIGNLTSLDTLGLSGRYVLGIEISNSSIGFSKEAIAECLICEDWVN